ncbi:MAG: hypothetical protein KAR20_04135, partial [Candidatus Heimdallarchaeota archaeon]|nr:hypothetical protein [Candidatus Heimdallarchaeota archaeon]
MKSRLFIINCIFVFILVFAVTIWAAVPAPPVNQTIGVDDGIFNDMLEAECRFCHEDPAIVEGESHIPNRHHLLMNSDIQTGECSVIRNACIADSECDSGICSSHNVPCSVDADCPDEEFGETCGEICIGEAVVKDIDANNDGENDENYACLNCHT